MFANISPHLWPFFSGSPHGLQNEYPTNDPFAIKQPPTPPQGGQGLSFGQPEPSPHFALLALLARFGQGIQDPFVQTAQRAAHLPSPFGWIDPALGEEKRRIADRFDQAASERNRSYEFQRGPIEGIDWPRLLGNIVSPVGLARRWLP